MILLLVVFRILQQSAHELPWTMLPRFPVTPFSTMRRSFHLRAPFIFPGGPSRLRTSPHLRPHPMRIHLLRLLRPELRISDDLSLSAILGSFNSGQDTVLTFWKRAEAYLLFAWNWADCYPAHRVSLHTIHTNLDAYRDTRSLSLISGLSLPYTP